MLEEGCKAGVEDWQLSTSSDGASGSKRVLAATGRARVVNDVEVGMVEFLERALDGNFRVAIVNLSPEGKERRI